MSVIPSVPADQNIIKICEDVAAGNIPLSDGIEYIGKSLTSVLGDCTNTNVISVYAVKIVEVLIPTSLGVFMTDEEMLGLWNDDKPRNHPSPLLLFTFVLLSCMQLTSTGPKREGAKMMGQYLDKILPEDCEIDAANERN
ncbi:MAG: hypothetical protein HRU15_05395 [Planctomycetes bacterium]|nr:hypothetical protein [Planctomycetota bacterium]